MTGARKDGASGGGELASLAVRLRTLRERALLTQEALGERSGLSVGTIRGIESGRIRRPRNGSLRLLADALELTGPEREALIGRGRPGGAAPPMVVVAPRQLPADVAAFTGRRPELARLEEALGSVDPPAPVVIAVHGVGGIGKSALAIHAAHRLAGRFPDGQLYVNLHGATPGLAPLEPLEVLGRFLRSLGVRGDEVPAEVEEAAARYRSELASRRLLVVLDDAADAGQVAPLLPGAPGCGVVVTSRRVLAGLDGARHLGLGLLPAEEAVGLLGRLAGEARVGAEPEAAAEVAGWCGYLPLALRIAGVRLAARPNWPVRALAERLGDAQRRLAELELPDVGVTASLEVSHRELRAGDPLDRAAAEAFALLGLLDGPDLAMPVAARLLDLDDDGAGRVLERLVDAQLLETPAPGRYRLHDLLRLYARDLAARQHGDTERAAALTRALRLYTATAWRTLALLRPGDLRLTRADERCTRDPVALADAAAALAWLDAEHANLLAAVHQAATTPGVPDQVAPQLASALFGSFTVRGEWGDWIRVNQVALAAARRAGDHAAQAQALNDLGVARLYQGHSSHALGLLHDSLAIRRRLGDRPGQAISLNNLGLVHQSRGDHAQAQACLEDGLALFQQLDARHGQGVALTNLGDVHMRQGDPRRALTCLEPALAVFRELGDRHGEAESLCSLGRAHERQGDQKRALACLEESLAIRRQLGDRPGQAESLRELGVTLRALGDRDRARSCWQQALAIFEQLQDAGAARELSALLDQVAVTSGDG